MDTMKRLSNHLPDDPVASLDTPYPFFQFFQSHIIYTKEADITWVMTHGIFLLFRLFYRKESAKITKLLLTSVRNILADMVSHLLRGYTMGDE
ncbi:MAG: hypothetical protein K2O18_15500 [Oscillospiraceae bacterium]|nr:hypothetical protein [Oscillospiraceae bacterium]